MTAMFLLAWLIMVGPVVQADTVEVEAQFLKRPELPDDFRFNVLTLGFAVMRVQIVNRSEEPWSIDPENIQVKDPRGKTITRALPTEITPKIVASRSVRSPGAGTHGEVGYGGPVYHPGQLGRRGVGAGSTGAGTISIEETKFVRSTLEHYELKQTTLEPGESVEALVYFHSKQPASKLAGSKLVLPSHPAVSVK
jgi:hypothetical protein